VTRCYDNQSGSRSVLFRNRSTLRFPVPDVNVKLCSARDTSIMAEHKICALIHFVLGIGLFFVLVTYNGPSANILLFALTMLMAGAAGVGCWTRRRWMVAIAALPILFASLVVFGIAEFFSTALHSDGMGFFMFLAGLVWILEAASIMYAKEEPGQGESSQEPR
jgi:hypothetical protein